MRRAKPGWYCSRTQRHPHQAVRTTPLLYDCAANLCTAYPETISNLIRGSKGTTQVCLFRDSYEPLTATGFDIYGLSTDSPKANTTFKTKQNLPYHLLCDKAATLIAAIGFKNGAKTQRGVFVVTKDGKVLAAEPGGPAATVAVVKTLVEKMGGTDSAGQEKLEKAEERASADQGNEGHGDDQEKADIAGEVADTAAKLDA